MRRVSASAPGKLIITGEHSVLYGYPAIVSTIDLFATVEVEKSQKSLISIEDTKFGTFSIERSKASTIGKSEAFSIMLKAIDIFAEFTQTEFNGLKIHSDSEVPIGGFGSSTALTAALVKALAKFFTKDLTADQLVQIVTETEMWFHGKVSGLDQTVVAKGGFIRYQNSGGEVKFDQLSIPEASVPECLVVNTGMPAEKTGEMVEFIANKYTKNREIKQIFEELGSISNKILVNLKQNRPDKFMENIRDAGELLIRLGIVTPTTQKLISRLERLGAVCKISGAGGLSGEGSGALLCFANNLSPIEDYLESQKLEFYNVKLGGQVI